MAYSPEKPTYVDETGIHSAEKRAIRLQQVAGGPPGYRLRRIILTNFWLYDHQVIEIPHGRLFLAGDNGSGKSTVLTAAITLALDGDHRPERIDTFGKREKKIEYYILGGESNTPFSREQRTSYIGLEFEWCEMQEPPFASELRALWEKGEFEKARFLTIGLGFAGNKHRADPITAMRFLITDGTRLDSQEELSTLVSVPGENPHACDLKTFRKAISAHGLVCDRQTDYAQKVAHYLFNFQKTEDLTRLTRQLLYLRQPNLNSVLSLDLVRSYLDESLPELPIGLIQRAAEMLDKMQEIQDTTATRQLAFDAAEKLHHAQKIAAMARARLSACDSLYTLALFEQKRREVQRLERAIKKSERDVENLQAHVKQLENEALELSGKISALEKSEGIQLARRFSDVQAQVQSTEESLVRSASALVAATNRREQTEVDRDHLTQVFQQLQRETLQLLQSMHTSADTEARWLIAAEQLLAASERVRELALEVAQLDIPEALSSLGEHAIAERLDWLNRLKALHTELEVVGNNVRVAHQREQQAYNGVDELTREFEQKRTDVCIAQQKLADHLTLLLDATNWASLLPSIEQAAQIWNASQLAAESVPALAQVYQTYIEAIKRVLGRIGRDESALSQRLTRVHREQGARESELDELRKIYQQKLLEPEFVPWRATHRKQAREALAAAGIQALPFYMLIDFAEEIDSQSPLAGGIENALADAGLLDALVVLPADSAALDAYCIAQGLSDCHLDLTCLTDERIFAYLSLTLTRALRVDPALSTDGGEKAAAWRENGQLLLASIQATAVAVQEDASRWTHGLLAGTVGTGEARCIGKATRVRIQQQELAHLCAQEEQLAQELSGLAVTIAQIEHNRQELIDLSKALAGLVPESNVSELSVTLQAALENLHRAQIDYQQVQETARTLGQTSRELKVRLEKEAERTPLFAADPARVERAREAVQSLRSEHKTLIFHLANLRQTWKNYQRVQRQLVQDASEERNATISKQRDENAVTRSRAELTILEQLAQETGGSRLTTLQQELATWKSRQESLPREVMAATTDAIRAQSALETHSTHYTEALTDQKRAEKQHTNSLQTFTTLLSDYPVEMLLDIQKQLETSPMRPQMLQQVLGQELEQGVDAYDKLKGNLERSISRTGTELSSAFVEVNSLLHEYGPHFDEAGVVRFTNAEEVNAYELLTRLGAEIRLQEQLLEAREYELFRDFLLKEMANTVGTRLTDAEAWIERMNAILADTPFMEERYRLKWVVRPHDPLRPGSHLALYRDVLRRQAETFNQEEIEKLVDAFKQEIKNQHSQQTTSTFTDALVNILDYRRWFQFEIDMLHANGTVQHLTTKFFRSGSGAEQYIALYIPFFTALSALYERAGKGAPRLLALDEAFEKVSATNTKKLLNFLARQNFQWIMTGPRVTGEGTELPACVKYTMFCRKSEELAAGFPAFWSNDPAIAQEPQRER